MSAFSRSRRIALCLAVLTAAAGWSGVSIAQSNGGSRISSPAELFQQRVQRAGANPSSIPLEGPIDPNEYVVGPGDVFSLNISALETIAAAIPVTADGHLVLPGAGAAMVAGATLSEAIEAATARLRQRYSNVEISLSLASPRQFYVHVVGAVTAPGRYVVMPVSRVSDALALAHLDTTRAPVGNPDFRPAFRNVTVHRRDGTQLAADLMAYLAIGSTELNPYLRDGDVVSVPAYDPDKQSVSISGHVPFPGTYDHRKGESVRHLVALASGLPDSILSGRVRVLRRASGEMTDQFLSMDDGGGNLFFLQARDHVFILPEKSVEGFAHVEGRVSFPGSYPIEQGETTVSDLIQMAGGFQEDALLRGAYLVRNHPDPEPKKMDQLFREPGQILPGSGLETPAPFFFAPYLTDAPSPEILRTLRLSDLDFQNRIYFAQEMSLMNRVSLDLGTESEQTVLMDGDRLIVPHDPQTVFVFGQVNQPGFVAVQNGGRMHDYVRAAGGLTDLAKDVFLIQVGTRSYRRDVNLPVQSGDMIFASRETDVADTAELQRLVLESDRAKAEIRSRSIGIVLQAVTSVATVVALIVTLGKN